MVDPAPDRPAPSPGAAGVTDAAGAAGNAPPAPPAAANARIVLSAIVFLLACAAGAVGVMLLALGRQP